MIETSLMGMMMLCSSNLSTRTEVPRPAPRGEGEVKTRRGGAWGEGGRRLLFIVKPLL